MKPTLLGEAPSKTSDLFYTVPLRHSARVLCDAAGIRPNYSSPASWTVALYDRFECLNLFERYADAQPWSVPRARARVASAFPTSPRVLVCLGRRVEEAVMGYLSVPPPDRPDFHEWVRVGGLYVASTPHPSGLNRLLNDEDERRALGRTLVDALAIAASL